MNDKIRNITVTVNIEGGFTKARLVPENISLDVDGNSITVPEVNGYAIIELS